MLEKLDGIDWKSLSHACGDASDIPDLIRALISQDKTVRDDAYDCLYTTLFHQGARWAASSYAIPFLYEILADKAAQDKAGLIEYILHLAVGYPDEYMPLGYDKAGNNTEDGRLCYLKAAEGVPLLYQQSFSEDEKVRSMAVYALSYFTPYLTEEILRRIEELVWQGGSDVEKAGAVMALGIVSRDSNKSVSLFKDLFSSAHSQEILKTAAAISSIIVSGPLSNKEEILYLATLSTEEVNVSSGEVLFCDGDIQRHINSVFECTDVCDIPFILGVFTDCFPAVNAKTTVNILSIVLKLIQKFHRDLPSPFEFEQLDISAQSILKASAEQDDLLWEKISPVFASYSYPSERVTFLAYTRGEYSEELQRFFTCRRDAESGDIESCYCLGDMIECGRVVRQDLQEALKWYEFAATHGHTDALHAMGRINHFYFHNYIKALEYYSRAADAGQLISMNNMGLLYENGLGVEKDVERAVSLYRRAAELGNSIAQNNMGITYEYGTGVVKDYDEAFKWYLMGAVQGEKGAMNNTGRMYYNGNGVEQSYEKAFEWYIKAADAGNGYAMNNIGYMYENGEYVARDDEKALEYYKRSAALGIPPGQNNMGRMYYNGRAVAQDYKEAAVWYRRAAYNGNKHAQNNLGRLYEQGLGVDKDYKQALEWFHKAAAQSYPPAWNNVGRMYYDGKGVTQDYEEARKYYLKAAGAGDVAAASNLGWIYEFGMGVDKDYSEAFKWYMYGAERDDGYSQNRIGLMYHYGKGILPNNEKAVFWYSKAIERNNADAMYNLGVLHHEKRDFPTALDWYIKAAEAGSSTAQNYLGEIYEHGKGVWQDDFTAVKYYKMSADKMNAKGLASLAWMYFNGKGVEQDYQEAIRLYRLSGDKGDEEGYTRALEIERFLLLGE